MRRRRPPHRAPPRLTPPRVAPPCHRSSYRATAPRRRSEPSRGARSRCHHIYTCTPSRMSAPLPAPASHRAIGSYTRTRTSRLAPYPPRTLPALQPPPLGSRVGEPLPLPCAFDQPGLGRFGAKWASSISFPLTPSALSPTEHHLFSPLFCPNRSTSLPTVTSFLPSHLSSSPNNRAALFFLLSINSSSSYLSLLPIPPKNQESPLHVIPMCCSS